jgi:predicted DNA-binding transcriptional regulator YafY
MVNVSDLAQQAIRERRLLRIRYRAESHRVTERTIETYLANEFYIDAYCRHRKDFRHFRIDRIEAAELLEETFPWNPEYFGFLKYSGYVNAGAIPRKPAPKFYLLPGNDGGV